MGKERREVIARLPKSPEWPGLLSHLDTILSPDYFLSSSCLTNLSEAWEGEMLSRSNCIVSGSIIQLSEY